MTEVLSKTNLFSSGNYQTRQQNTISVFTKSCRLKGFPSRVKPQGLRSQISRSSSCSDFYGKRVVVHGNQSKPRRGYLPQASVVALICQLAEMNPDVQFLQVNYEEHKSMCYSLNVHVLPFFRFYRGAHGRLCSFSCTNATIKKFKDALAKHTPERCSLGPTKGLEEKELVALAANKDLSFTYTPKPVQPAPVPAEEEVAPTASPSLSDRGLPLPLPITSSKSAQDSEEKTLVSSGR
ncbi:thioredoxin-like 1-1, chloroplastic isoform X2 [Populus nigra]|uniref:thioredoxin-like 1-1, chloroplastic isoform X2 n=1 Tax=Populus nigra TaxID=3691 RepID=UPI002B274696|nr:thioredoxin-like 1-1, chloroplastic isoform X2 [Populus nigra]